MTLRHVRSHVLSQMGSGGAMWDAMMSDALPARTVDHSGLSARGSSRNAMLRALVDATDNEPLGVSASLYTEMRDIGWAQYEEWLVGNGLEDTPEHLRAFGFAFSRAIRYMAGGNLLQTVSALLEGAADEIDGWFPNDPDPVIQDDLRNMAALLQERFRLSKFIPGDDGGHFEPMLP